MLQTKLKNAAFLLTSRGRTWHRRPILGRGKLFLALAQASEDDSSVLIDSHASPHWSSPATKKTAHTMYRKRATPTDAFRDSARRCITPTCYGATAQKLKKKTKGVGYLFVAIMTLVDLESSSSAVIIWGYGLKCIIWMIGRRYCRL